MNFKQNLFNRFDLTDLHHQIAKAIQGGHPVPPGIHPASAGADQGLRECT